LAASRPNSKAERAQSLGLRSSKVNILRTRYDFGIQGWHLEVMDLGNDGTWLASLLVHRVRTRSSKTLPRVWTYAEQLLPMCSGVPRGIIFEKGGNMFESFPVVLTFARVSARFSLSLSLSAHCIRTYVRTYIHVHTLILASSERERERWTLDLSLSRSTFDIYVGVDGSWPPRSTRLRRLLVAGRAPRRGAAL